MADGGWPGNPSVNWPGKGVKGEACVCTDPSEDGLLPPSLQQLLTGHSRRAFRSSHYLVQKPLIQQQLLGSVLGVQGPNKREPLLKQGKLGGEVVV